ncbi:MAG: DciA family protein [Gammaproteobacteria bacterium]|nr:DciA family protein [Gammaproteobacteria bacterium]
MKRLQHTIPGGSTIDRIKQQGSVLDKLTELVRQTLPAALRQHVTGCALNAKTLVVFVDQSEWTTHFRFLEAEILTMLDKHPEFGVERIQCRVFIDTRPPAPSVPDRKISAATRDLLNQTAESISDEKLAEALRRLASKTDDQAP